MPRKKKKFSKKSWHCLKAACQTDGWGNAKAVVFLGFAVSEQMGRSTTGSKYYNSHATFRARVQATLKLKVFTHPHSIGQQAGSRSR
jgi:hypothetical protein